MKFAFFAGLCTTPTQAEKHPVRQEVVDAVRAVASWEAIDVRSNPLALLSPSEAIGLSGYEIDSATSDRKNKPSSAPAKKSFPRDFDARVEFPHCKHKIRNQLKCKL